MSSGEGAASVANPLKQLANLLREERTVISQHVVDPSETPVLGPLAAAGPRAAAAPHEYALVVEAIREGYLLHYAAPRLLEGQDPDLSLLAGDYLYALGLERLAALGDQASIRELSDLISLCAACHADRAPQLVAALWLAVATAVACGGDAAHAAALTAARARQPQAADALRESARSLAARAGLEADLERACESIDFAPARPADLG